MIKHYKVYRYQHPITEEIFEEVREFNDRDRCYVAPDGAKCPRKLNPGEKKNDRPPSFNKNKDGDPPLVPTHFRL